MIGTEEIQKLQWEVGDLIAKNRPGLTEPEIRLLTERIVGKHEKFVRWRCRVFSAGEARETVFSLRDPGKSSWKLVSDPGVALS